MKRLQKVIPPVLYARCSTAVISCILSLAFSLPNKPASAASAHHVHSDERSAWIEKMKRSPRGPFRRIRWFCNDGSVHPPKEYACSERGGGVQHGQWSADTEALRADDYYIANVFADLSDETVAGIKSGNFILPQMLIEQFLINTDDGWILRKARFYRGAFQDEDERAGARKLLQSLTTSQDWLGYRYLLLRAAARFLDHGADSASVQEIRQLSASLSDENPAFKTLRAKIHGRPEANDAAAVRNFMSSLSAEFDPQAYAKLAQLIDEVYSDNTDEVFAQLAKYNFPEEVRRFVENSRAALAAAKEPLEKIRVTSDVLAELRDNIAVATKGEQRLALLG